MIMKVNTIEIQEKSLSYEDYLNSIDNLSIDDVNFKKVNDIKA